MDVVWCDKGGQNNQCNNQSNSEKQDTGGKT